MQKPKYTYSLRRVYCILYIELRLIIGLILENIATYDSKDPLAYFPERPCNGKRTMRSLNVDVSRVKKVVCDWMTFTRSIPGA